MKAFSIVHINKWLLSVLLLMTSGQMFAYQYQIYGTVFDSEGATEIGNQRIRFQREDTKDEYHTYSTSAGYYSYTFYFSVPTVINVILETECSYSRQIDTIQVLTFSGREMLNIYTCTTDQDVNAGFEYTFRLEDRTVIFQNTATQGFDSLSWEFGDEKFSTDENPEHSYNRNFSARVVLNGYLGNNYYRTQKDIDIVGNSSLAGTVYSGDVPMQNGRVFLLGYDKANLQISKTERINRGKIDLNDIETGSYVLFAVPEYDYDVFHYPHYIPTYSGNTFRWEESEIIDLNKNLDEYRLELISYPFPYYGDCSIQGSFRLSQSMDFSQETVYVILLNEDKIPIAYKEITQDNSVYQFKNLPEGVYFIHAEGLNRATEDTRVNLRNINPDDSQIDFDMDSETIIPRQKYRQNMMLSDISISIYRKKISINTSKSKVKGFIINLYDLNGRMVKETILDKNSDNVTLDARSLSSGIYFLSFSSLQSLERESLKILLSD